MGPDFLLIPYIKQSASCNPSVIILIHGGAMAAIRTEKPAESHSHITAIVLVCNVLHPVEGFFAMQASSMAPFVRPSSLGPTPFEVLSNILICTKVCLLRV